VLSLLSFLSPKVRGYHVFPDIHLACHSDSVVYCSAVKIETNLKQKKTPKLNVIFALLRYFVSKIQRFYLVSIVYNIYIVLN
jgi:hypothetical protein